MKDKEITLEDFKKDKVELESNIESLLKDFVNKFNAQSININIEGSLVTIFGDIGKRLVIENVSLSVEM